MPDALLILLRSLFAFFALLLLTRLMGHKQISQLTYFDYIVGITIGSIAATLSLELENEFLDGFVSILVWASLPILLEILSLKNNRARKVLDGSPDLIIQNGHVLRKNMAKARYNMDDLMSQLREKNIFRLSDVEFAYLESNGQLSVMKKPDKHSSSSSSNGKSDGKSGGLPRVVIMDGQVLKQNLSQAGFDESWLDKELRKRGIDDVKKVMVAQVDQTGLIYLDGYEEENRTRSEGKTPDRQKTKKP